MANGDRGNVPTLRSTIMGINPKIVLAFFLVTLAALLVVFFTLVLVRYTADGKASLDPGTIALLAGFITTFLLMAKSASDYQFTSSAGSDKKDDTVSKALADKLPGASADVAVAPWWGLLTDAEKNTVTAASNADARVAAFVTASQVGAATANDLTYLVGKGLLTQDRATAIAAA